MSKAEVTPKEPTDPLVVYHDNCHDGITALWCALQRWPNAEPYAGRYNDAPDLERMRDRDVVIVDFSWTRGPMSDILDVCRTMLVLDHHKTAKEELEGFVGNIIAKYKQVIDLERSGAGIAWDYLIGGNRHPLVDYVEDRDLWRFRLPHSREVHAACGSYPLTLDTRNKLMDRDVKSLANEGSAILRYHDKLVESAAAHAGRETIAGVEVPAIACPTIEIASDLGHKLALGQPFAAVYVDKPDGTRYYQLRSSDAGLDVGAIAKSLGGGGHRNAAGFTRKATVTS